MAKIWTMTVVVVANLLLSGCGTIFERGGRFGTYGQYYPGVKYDWEILSFEGNGGYDIKPLLCYLTIVCPVVVLVSVPLDFVVDTVALPFDRQKKLRVEAHLRESRKELSANAEGSGADTGTANAEDQ